MTQENFIYWLRGYLELSDPKKGLTMKQVDIIEDHLRLVVDKITPHYPTPLPVTPNLPNSPFTDPLGGTRIIC